MKLPFVVGVIASMIVLGMGMWATNFTVYLGHSPDACNNCHNMDAHYEGWAHSGHRIWANCIDCHTPEGFIPKYLYKAKSGYNHVTAYTLGELPDILQAKLDTKQYTQASCIRCHQETVAEIGDGKMDAGRYCVDCHRTVPHGERGVSTYPYRDTDNYPHSSYE